MNSEYQHILAKYNELDRLSDSGEDVVADLRKEIHNKELAYLKDHVLPKLANTFGSMVKGLRCEIDGNIRLDVEGKIEYMFGTSINMVMFNGEVKASDCIEETSAQSCTKTSRHNLASEPNLFTQVGIEIDDVIDKVESPNNDNSSNQTTQKQLIENSGCMNIAFNNQQNSEVLFSLNGGDPTNKTQTVLEVLRLYISTFPEATYREIEMAFPVSLQGEYGVVATLSSINYRWHDGEDVENRYFLNKDKLLRSSDEVDFAVCNQWNDNFNEFKTHVLNSFGWTIDEI